ncbi:hypothetical protein VNO78_20609 [Psophocarpus tetragonolobus]|uniref:Uncharacterized protein n=1 Tax=Psophocarpus tetragonolobus TaxID=3891 RepID=A0AAN9S9Q2_PSOTE
MVFVLVCQICSSESQLAWRAHTKLQGLPNPYCAKDRRKVGLPTSSLVNFGSTFNVRFETTIPVQLQSSTLNLSNSVCCCSDGLKAFLN